jgi:hypothetical protein
MAHPDGRRDQAAVQGEASKRRRCDGDRGERAQAHARRGRVVEVEGAGPGTHHLAGVARKRVEQFLLLELRHQGLAGRQQGLQLARLVLQVVQAPKRLDDASGLVGQAPKERQVGGVVGLGKVPVEGDDPEHLAIAGGHGRRHLAADSRSGRPVTQVRRGVGGEDRLGMQGRPARETLPREEGKVLCGRYAEACLRLQLGRFGIQEGYGTAVGGEAPGDDREHSLEGPVGVVRPGREGRQRVQKTGCPVGGARFHAVS